MGRHVCETLLSGQGVSAHRRRFIAALSMALSVGLAGVPTVFAAQTGGFEDGLSEVVVTARQRAESLQSVPDSVTAITSTTIERAGIQQVADFANLVPNMTFRETFREGASYITIRGVTTPQGGWAPVTYVVDGVPAGSVDAINTGALVGIERIEVLKGPQSAIYGSGAIAGAVNIITRAPADHLEGEAQAWYGNYGDERGVLMVSGPVADRVKFRVDAFYRHADGSQEDSDGLGMNFNRTGDVRGRLLIDLAPVQLDLRLHYVDTHAGAAYQEFLPPGAAGLKLIDNFTDSPGIQRGIRGYEDVRNIEGSLKAEWNAGFATLTSLSSYSKLDDGLFGTTSWQKPPGASFCGAVGGGGEPPDCAQSSEDNFKVFTQDVRLTSASDQVLRWLVGTSYLHREAPNTLLVGGAALDPSGKVVAGSNPFVNSTYLRHDNFAGVYGQVNYNITHALEATAALRWDENRYNSTQYTSLSLQTPVSLPDGTVTQRKTDAAVQPKFQLSYHWTEDLMTYATAAKGFRSGFFYSGNFTRAESTWNYEAGVKSEFADHRVTLNFDAFHINYSDQQYTSITSTPPYRQTSNIPSTRINGAEAELTARPVSALTLGAGIGYTDARVNDDTAGPYTPRFTVNLSAEHSLPLTAGWRLISRVDYRYQDAQYLGRENLYEVGPKDYVNLRVVLDNGQWKIAAYGNNLSNARQAFQFDNVGFGYLRYNNNPRTYGGEVAVRF
jgi:iron complex outermembrane receptor protein